MRDEDGPHPGLDQCQDHLAGDVRTLALVDHAVVMAQDLQQGNAPQVNDSTTYDNGVRFVPSFLFVPVTVTAANAAAAYQDDPVLCALTQP
jgi:putative multiple sugar transport system substrate-binding protein